MGIQWCQACGLLPGRFRTGTHLHGDAVLCDDCHDSVRDETPLRAGLALVGLVGASLLAWVVVLVVAYLVTR